MKPFSFRLLCFITAIVMLTAGLCGCAANEKGFPIPLSPEEKSAFEMCTTMYTEDQLEEIFSYMAEEKNIDSLDKKYEVQCLRKTDEGHQVIYASIKTLLILSFDADAKYIEKDRRECLRSLVKSVAVFDELNIGDSVQVVQTIDQKCYITFLEGQKDAPLVSDHYSEDGYHIIIGYDADEKVVSIDKKPI